jgi:hypothetical protein
VDYSYQRLLFQLTKVDFASIRIYFREVFGVHGEKGLLKVEFLSGGEDAEVAVGVIGEGFGYALVLLCVDFYHSNSNNVYG